MTTRQVTVQKSDNGPLNEEFDQLAKEAIEQWHVPGLSIAVVDGDQTWAKVGFFLSLTKTSTA